MLSTREWANSRLVNPNAQIVQTGQNALHAPRIVRAGTGTEMKEVKASVQAAPTQEGEQGGAPVLTGIGGEIGNKVEDRSLPPVMSPAKLS